MQGRPCYREPLLQALRATMNFSQPRISQCSTAEYSHSRLQHSTAMAADSLNGTHLLYLTNEGQQRIG
ncbi:hypothetical protein WJX77_010643 [Trebouxia sp. C0004]